MATYKPNITAPLQQPNVNHGAGLNLLDHYQDRWHCIHTNSQICCKKSELVIEKLAKIELSSAKLSISTEQLIVGYRSLDFIDEQIQEVSDELDELFSLMKKVENVVMALKRKQELKELQTFTKQLNEDTNWAIKEKEIQYAIDKERINTEHKRRLAQIEQERDQKLEERRLLYEKAFKEEKQKYLESLHKYETD